LSNALSLTGQIFQVVQNLQKKLDRAGSICRPLQIVQNHEFYQNLGLIQFLREFGYFFPMNPLISRDFINQRQDGVTYTEFSYGLLQAFDFFKLFTEYDCAGQFGGSDQWSNITSGTELIRKKLGKASFGCTLPLLTTKDGKKFGKTEGNALFLSPQLTTAHDIYQYCFNQPDDLIEELMLRLTFISEEEIKDLLSLPLESRAPQKRLGLEVLEVLHGKEVAENTQRVSELVFSEKYSQIENKDLETLSGFAGRVEVTQTMMQSPFFTFLKEAKIVQSNKEAKNLLKTRAVKFNGQVLTEDSQLAHCGWVRDQFGVLTVGKKQIFLLLKPESP
jgi:tyrosyl-tRNA synthetase